MTARACSSVCRGVRSPTRVFAGRACMYACAVARTRARARQAPPLSRSLFLVAILDNRAIPTRCTPSHASAHAVTNV
eukprot:6198736-Pleurochrysis_carterae.AAC.1